MEAFASGQVFLGFLWWGCAALLGFATKGNGMELHTQEKCEAVAWLVVNYWHRAVQQPLVRCRQGGILPVVGVAAELALCPFVASR